MVHSVLHLQRQAGITSQRGPRLHLALTLPIECTLHPAHQTIGSTLLFGFRLVRIENKKWAELLLRQQMRGQLPCSADENESHRWPKCGLTSLVSLSHPFPSLLLTTLIAGLELSVWVWDLRAHSTHSRVSYSPWLQCFIAHG